MPRQIEPVQLEPIEELPWERVAKATDRILDEQVLKPVRSSAEPKPVVDYDKAEATYERPAPRPWNGIGESAGDRGRAEHPTNQNKQVFGDLIDPAVAEEVDQEMRLLDLQKNHQEPPALPPIES